MRESLFARTGDLEDAAVLDLYAGTGALGIEALSRGAAHVVFVERAAAAVAVLRGNLARLELEGRSRVLRSDARAALRRLAREGRRFDLVLADPPYEAPGVAEVLGMLASGNLLPAGGTLVVERSRRHPVAALPGLGQVASRRYGDTVVEWRVRGGEGPRGPQEPTPGASREAVRDAARQPGRAPEEGQGEGQGGPDA